MPLYEYKCDECATLFEQRRAMADADKVTVCPLCSSLLTRRIFSVVAVLSGSRPKVNSPPTSNRKTHHTGCACCIPERRR